MQIESWDSAAHPARSEGTGVQHLDPPAPSEATTLRGPSRANSSGSQAARVMDTAAGQALVADYTGGTWLNVTTCQRLQLREFIVLSKFTEQAICNANIPKHEHNKTMRNKQVENVSKSFASITSIRNLKSLAGSKQSAYRQSKKVYAQCKQAKHLQHDRYF